MWCKNRKKVIKEMKQRGEDPSALLPQPKPEQKPGRNLPRVQSQKEITPSDRGRSLPRVASQKDFPERGRSGSIQPSVGQTYKDPSLGGTYKDSPVKVNSSRSEPFAPYVKPGAHSSEDLMKQQSVKSETYSPVITHSAPTMPTALLVHPSALASAQQQQSSTVTSMKSSSELPSLVPKQEISEPPPPMHQTSTLSVPHSSQQTREPSPEDSTLPLKFMDITQFKAPEDLDDEDKLGDHRRSPGPPTLEPMLSGPIPGGPMSTGSSDPLPPPNLDPDMHQLTSLLQQGGSVEDVARTLNITLDAKTSELLHTLKQQLDLAATLQNKPELPVFRSNKSASQQGYAGPAKQDSGYGQSSQYGFDSGRYGGNYPETSYGNQGYDQSGHVGDQDKETGNTGVKAALATLLAQQGHRVSMGGTEFSQQDPYSQTNPIYSKAHRHDEPYYSKSDQPDFGGTVYREDQPIDPPYSRRPGELPSESMTTNTGPAMGMSHGSQKSFGYHGDEHTADTSTVDSGSKYGYGQGMGQVPDSKHFYGSDSYSDSDGGLGSMNRRRSSLASTTSSDLGSGDGRGRNLDTGPGFSGRGNMGQRTGQFNRSESDGARPGPSLLGSPPFRSNSGQSFGRQTSDEGIPHAPRSKSPGAGLLGYGGNHFGMNRGGSNQGPRPLMSFDAGRGRKDRGGYKGGWK